MVRSRWKWILLGVVLLLVGAEVGLNALKAPVALVKIVNHGDDPILNLEITSGSVRSGLARIDSHQTAMFPFSGSGVSPLTLKFNQLNNPVTDLEVTDFDPRRLSREGSVLVLEGAPNEVARYQEPDETPGRWGRLLASFRRLFEAEKGTEP